MAKNKSSKVELPGCGGVLLALVIVLGLLSLVAIFKENFIDPKPHPRPSPDPTPVVTPSPGPTSSPTFDELVYSEVKKFTEGRLAFNPTSTMKQGTEERIEARIASEDIGPILTQGFGGKGTPEVAKIKVASVMKLTLSGEKDVFRITPLSSEEQLVSSQPYAQWEWTVTPLDYGECNLHLKATARVIVEGYGERSVDVPVITKTIQVRVSPGYIIKTRYNNASTLQLILGGSGVLGLLGSIGGLVRWLVKKKKAGAGFIRPK
jgi:hypothetical protein